MTTVFVKQALALPGSANHVMLHCWCEKGSLDCTSFRSSPASHHAAVSRVTKSRNYHPTTKEGFLLTWGNLVQLDVFRSFYGCPAAACKTYRGMYLIKAWSVYREMLLCWGWEKGSLDSPSLFSSLAFHHAAVSRDTLTLSKFVVKSIVSNNLTKH